MTRCIGCLGPAAHRHHAIYQQAIRRADKARYATLIKDERNLVPVCLDCHACHHNRVDPLELAILPDSVFEFARELLGPGAAYEYLARLYQGSDPRLERLNELWGEAA